MHQAANIDSDTHERTIKKQNKKPIHITKLVHDILPTNSNLHQRNPKLQCCPQCSGNTLEDQDHIMRCQSTSRAQWRADLIIALEKKCTALQTDLVLSRILLQGVSIWMNQQELLRPDDFPDKYSKLIRQQNAMGWKQLFNRRMSKEWARIQDDHLFVMTRRRHDLAGQPSSVAGRIGPPDKGHFGQQNGSTWTTEIITTLWEQWALIWTMQNADIHRHDEITRSQQLDRSNRQRLEMIYDRKMQMEPQIRELLVYNTVDEHMQHSQRTVQNWLAVHEEETITQSIKHAAKRAIQGMRSIRSFFRSRCTQSIEQHTQ